MKQSTKLLSLVLALIMAFSCMSVIGNAVTTFTGPTQVAYDNIDDANLTAEQVADIALDLVDDLLADADIHFSQNLLVDTLEVDLRTVDRTFETLSDTANGGLFAVASGMFDVGVLEKLDYSALGKPGYQRSGGNLKIIYQLVQFLYDNRNELKNVVYGINTDNGIRLGIIGNFLGSVDFSEINNILTNLPGFALEMVYDLLLYGSYNESYPDKSYPSAEDLKAEGKALPFDNMDVMLNNAILNLVINPQYYSWEGEGKDAVKVWDEAVFIPSLKAEVEKKGRDAVIAEFDLTQKSVFDVLNYAAQWAIDDLGINALNHNLKKNLMEAVEVEFNKIEGTSVPADVKEIFDAEKYVTAIGYDCLEKSTEDGKWYYTTFENVPVDANGDKVQDTDPETEEPLTVRDHVYYKANTAVANEFYNLINWDYEFVKSTDDNAHVEVWEDEDGVEHGPNTINYDYILANYGGTLTGALNHLVYIVYETALNPEIKADFADITGDPWIDGITSECINDNIGRLLRYLLANFADKIFGSDSPYADTEVYNYDFYAELSLIDIIALIGPGFFDGTMPQLIIPKDENGAYAFAQSDDGSSVALLQFAALVIREFATEIAPNVNYDAAIFGDTLTSEGGRQFNPDNTAEDWLNIILNIGTDIGATYLMQITNFKDYCTKVFGADFDLNGFLTAGGGTDPVHWNSILDTAIEWGVSYVSGDENSSVLKGISLKDLDKYGDYTTPGSSLKKLSYILNTILPLGFINGLNSEEFDVDATVLLDKLLHFFTTFDLTDLVSLFGRNGVPGADFDTDDDYTRLKRYNILDKPVIPMVLGLVNDIVTLVLGGDLFPSETTVQSNLNNTQIQTILVNLLTNLNNVKVPLLTGAAPVLGKLIKGWGTEQDFAAPSMDVDSYVQTNGAGEMKDGNGNNYTNTGYLTNGANGIWRSYMDGTRKYDDQYAVRLTDVKAYNFDGSTASEITVKLDDTDGENNSGYLDFGETGTFTYTTNTAIKAPGKIVRFEISYQVYEGSNLLSNETFKTSSYVFFDYYNSSDAGTMTDFHAKADIGFWAKTYSPQFIDIAGNVEEQVANMPVYGMDKDQKTGDWGAGNQVDGTMSGESKDGFTVGTMNFYFNDGNRDYYNVKAFTSYTVTTEQGKDTASVNGSFDYNTWKAAGLESGDETALTITNVAEHYEKPLVGKTKHKGTYTADTTFKILYWNSDDQQILNTGVSREAGLGKVKTDYDLTKATYYADSYLNANPTAIVDGEEVKKETNFTEWVWLNDKGEVVSKDIVTVDENSDDDTIGYYDNNTKTAHKVTVINSATAWTNYENAFKAAMESGLGIMRSDRNRRYLQLLENLEVAAADLGYVDRANTNANLDTEIDTLASNLKTIENTYTKNYDYTDYRMYRLNRLNDNREDAQYYIDLKKDAKRTIDMVDETFPYTWIEEDDLRSLVSLNSDLQKVKDDGNDKTEDNIVLALLDKMEGEEYDSRKEWLDDRELEYAQTSLLDVKITASLLDKTSKRLIDREYKSAGKANMTHLANEVASAEAMITDSSLYTEKSWTKYAAALKEAKDVLTEGTSQMKAFDAKWELLCCRNELVLVDEEANYSELEALIAQAEWALNNMDKYNNTAEEFGQVLAELGLKNEVKNANGDAIELFPGNARYIFSEPYSTEEQGAIDTAARELKEALAKLKFNNLAVTGNEGSVAIEEEGIIVFDDETTEEIETVTARLATIASGLNEGAVKALFNVKADDIFEDGSLLPENIIVSNDLHYSVEKADKEYEGFVGTNAVLTFYTVTGGVRVPVATVKIIVKGDINGDGTVDVIDAAQLNLVATDKAEIDGCYYIAGNLTGTTDETRKIDSDDYANMMNTVLGCEVVA